MAYHVDVCVGAYRLPPMVRRILEHLHCFYIREFRGKLHEVTVLESGFEYGGTTYRSLTEIAKVITGSKWSGPAFFGLTRRARSVAA